MAISSDSAPDDVLLRRYLLGLTPEAETEQLDERSIADEEFALLLRSAEYDLADAYAAGDLAGDELKAFRSVYMSSAGGRDTVRFADTLLRYQERPARSWASWAFAAAAVVLLATSAYQLGENWRLRRDVASIRAETAALADRARRLQQQLEERSARDTIATPAPSRTPETVTLPVIASFILTPATRGADTGTTIAIPPGSEGVRLHLPLEGDPAPSFDAVLRDAATREVVWRGTGFHIINRSSVAVSVTIPADLFSARGYVVDLSGVRSGRASEPAGTYPFSVVMP
jgi:hypothetical protein